MTMVIFHRNSHCGADLASREEGVPGCTLHRVKKVFLAVPCIARRRCSWLYLTSREEDVPGPTLHPGTGYKLPLCFAE